MVSILGDAESAIHQVFYEQPKEWLIGARERMKDLPKTNYELGCKFAQMGKWHDAMFRFRIALYLQPDYPAALYNLGCCYYQIGQRDKARDALQKVLQKEPGNQDALVMLSAIDPQAVPANLRPQSMPRDLILKFFSSIAPDYNQAEAASQYRGGVAVADVVKPLLPPSNMTVVDLGCGTGIASIPYRATAQHITGVDMTPAMVAAAQAEMYQERKLFDRVVEADIANPGDAISAGSADLVLLVNVAQFVGALNGVISAAAKMLKAGGFMAITVEPYSGTDGFGLVVDSGRFGHTPNYVQQQAAAQGLSFVKEARLALYPETQAQLMVFRKGNA